MADCAAGSRARHPMISCNVAGDAANDGALGAAFGVDDGVSERERGGEGEGGEGLFQLRLLFSDASMMR
jgi:hypothetical protein